MFFKKLSGNKKGDFISLFVIVIIFSVIYPQLGFDQLLHLNNPNISHYSNSPYLKFINKTDILYITKNDSSKIYKSESIMESNYKIKDIAIKTQFKNYYSILKTNQDLLLFKMTQNYTGINSEIFFNYNKNIIPSLFFQFDNNQDLSYGIGANFIKNSIKINIKYRLLTYSYKLYFSYDDFVFNQLFSRQKESYKFNLSYNKSKFNFRIKIGYNNYHIKKPTLNNSNQSLEDDDYKKYIFEINTDFKLNNNNKINLFADFNYNQQAISLVNNNVKIIKINNLEISDRKIKIAYSFNVDKINYNIGYLKKYIDLECTGRLRTSVFGDNLIASISAPIVNTYDIGKIITNSIFLSSKKVLKDNLNIIFNVMYIKDNFDIVMKNDLINIFVDPEIIIQTFKYKSKDALELAVEFNYKINKINLLFNFSQHIPLKIEKISSEQIDPISGSNTQYGGGKFQILISKEI